MGDEDRDGRLRAIDDGIRADPAAPLSHWFASWPLEDYARLYLTDLARYPALEARLPRMPTVEQQRRWTGNDGAVLMGQSVAFARGVEAAYLRYVGRPLAGVTALDYGAGWGRLTRLFLRRIDDERMHAADPWPASADLFDSLGFRRRCERIEGVPSALPWAPGAFDLVWLFSVLTHLPAHAADAVMEALRPVVNATGMLVVTVRPADIWRRQGEPELLAEQERTGFAHRPASTLWGDTSMSIEHLAARWPAWRVVGSETHPPDPLQTIVYLRPAAAA